jgi:putative two-component system response regulator
MAPHALIIDDDVNNLQILSQLLESQGVSSTLVADPAQTLVIAAGGPEIDVVFCDLEMPHIDGYQLLAKLQEQLNKQIPIICSSVHLTEIDTAYARGFDGFLAKPLDADRFPSQLARILEGLPVWEVV